MRIEGVGQQNHREESEKYYQSCYARENDRKTRGLKAVNGICSSGME